MKLIYSFTLLIICSIPVLNAQHNIVEDHEGEQDVSSEHGHEAFRKHHTVYAMMAFSYIPSIIPGKEQREILAVPTWALNYNFWFHPKWAIGLHNDLILQQFQVERHSDKEEIIRSYPVAVKVVVSFEPIHELVIMTGYGKEIEPNKILDVVTAGVEYGIPIRNGWEAGLSLCFDWNIENYVSWMFGIGFGKKLYHRKK